MATAFFNISRTFWHHKALSLAFWSLLLGGWAFAYHSRGRLVLCFCDIGHAISLDYYGQSERSWATSATVFSEVRLCPTASFLNSSLYCLWFSSMFSLTSFNLIIALKLVSSKAGEVQFLLLRTWYIPASLMVIPCCLNSLTIFLGPWVGYSIM